jgi:hypothetical protein
LPNKWLKHADIVNECIRLFVKDPLWQKAMTKQFASAFCLDHLIASPDPNIQRVGISMAASLLIKVPALEMADIVHDDYSMELISRKLFRILIDNQTKGRKEVDALIDELH